MGELNNDAYQDALRIRILYDILDKALIADPKLASAAKDVDIGFITDEYYIRNRYGIDKALFKCWVRDRKLFDYSWQHNVSSNVEELKKRYGFES